MTIPRTVIESARPRTRFWSICRRPCNELRATKTAITNRAATTTRTRCTDRAHALRAHTTRSSARQPCIVMLSVLQCAAPSTNVEHEKSSRLRGLPSAHNRAEFKGLRRFSTRHARARSERLADSASLRRHASRRRSARVSIALAHANAMSRNTTAVRSTSHARTPCALRSKRGTSAQ